MRNYQSVLILKPDLDEAQVEQSIEKITSSISKFGGAILKLDNWGKKRLAYRVKKNKFGYYLNIYHTCEPGGVPALEREYQLYELIIKYLVIRLEERDIERVMSQKAEGSESSEAGAEGDSEKDVAAEKSEGDSKEGVAAEKSEDDSKNEVVAEKSD